jgi:hypothetical protein
METMRDVASPQTTKPNIVEDPGEPQLTNMMCFLKCVCKLNVRKFIFFVRYIVKCVNVNLLTRS